MTGRRTPLYDRHLALGGRLVNFAGWDLPQQYTSIKDEQQAVRTRAGLFDISHMGRVEVSGAAAQDFLQGLFTNDLGRLEPGRAQYTLMCNQDGGILDDLVVYRRAEQDFLVVFNAANRERDLAWAQSRAPKSGVEIQDRTFELSLLALQGPRAAALLPSPEADDIVYFGLRQGEAAGVPALIARTGYTGEDGFEIFVSAEQAGIVWDRLLEAGAAPCGLGARDACRLEAGLRLYGQDMDESTNPFEAGLGWTVKLQKGDFVGRRALEQVKASGPARELIGLKAIDRSIPRHGMPVGKAGRPIGEVTSGTYSFWLNRGIAMARVEAGRAPLGSEVQLDVRGQPGAAEVVAMPFYRGSVRSPAASRS